MTRLKALGAIAVAAALVVASPAVARGFGAGGMHTGAGAGAMHMGAGVGTVHAAPQFSARGAPQVAARGTTQFAPRGTAQFADHNRRFHNRGWGPGVGAGLAAGALLGGAYGYYDPYYGDAYAYDNDDDGYYYNDPGFVCQPGTWFVGADGRRHLCQ